MYNIPPRPLNHRFSVFADASREAFGTCAYLRSFDGAVNVRFVAAK